MFSNLIGTQTVDPNFLRTVLYLCAMNQADKYNQFQHLWEYLCM